MMSFDVHPIDELWSSLTQPAPSRRARVARAGVALARFALAGPKQWRQALTTALMGVGKRIVSTLDDRYAHPPPSAVRHADVRPTIVLDPHPPSAPPPAPGDTAWAVWM